MSDTTPIPNLEGVSCWICLDTDNKWWVRGTILCAWYEAQHSPLDGCEGDRIESRRVLPTVLATANESGEHWIIQLPSSGEIRFCDDAHTDWNLDGEEQSHDG